MKFKTDCPYFWYRYDVRWITPENFAPVAPCPLSEWCELRNDYIDACCGGVGGNYVHLIGE